MQLMMFVVTWIMYIKLQWLYKLEHARHKKVYERKATNVQVVEIAKTLYPKETTVSAFMFQPPNI